MDASGNAYVTGYTYSFGPGSPSQYTLSLLKYDATGSLLWQRTWSGSGNGTDNGLSVAVDPSNNSNIYVTGSTSSFGAGGYDVVLLKFSSAGSLLWQRTWGGSGTDVGQGVAVDSSGNIYVTGYTFSFGAGFDDVVLLKFDSSGSLLWQKTWGGSGLDAGLGVAVDPSNNSNIYVTGYTFSFGAGGEDFLLLKFDSSGSLLWQRTWGGSSSDSGRGFAVDSSGNVYVTGWTFSFGACCAVLLKFSSAGSLLWQRTWGGSGLDSGSGVAVDPSNNSNIYVTGSSGFGAGGYDVVLLKFSSAGSLLWQRTWGGSSNDVGSGVAVDSSGNAVVTGYVSEALPYTLGTPSGTLGTTGNSTLGVPAFTLKTPTFTLHTPSGTVQTPSGIQSYAGGLDEFLIKYGYGLLPTISFQTSPNVGTITFSGTTYTNGQSGNFAYAAFLISAHPPAGYVFSSWSSTGGVAVASASTNTTTATITGSGTLQANFVPASPPSAPQSLQAAAASGSISLTWSAPTSDGGSPVTTYKVYRGTSSGGESLLTALGNVLSFTDTGLTNGQIYYYQVTALNLVGESGRSNEASATPAATPVTVTFNDAPASGGTIVCGTQTFSNGQTGQFPQTSTLICTANASPGYKFSGWSGLASGTSNPVTFNVGNGGTLTANFTGTTIAPLHPSGVLLAALITTAIMALETRRRKLHLTLCL